MIDIEANLRKVTRRIAFWRGGARLIEPIRRHYVGRYAAMPDRFAEIDDFDGDMKLRIDRAAYMGSLIYWRGYHSYRELQVLDRLLTPAMTFVDVGANRGEFTLFAAKRIPKGRVLSFEPSPESYAELAHNVALNEFTNVVAFPFGLADSNRRQKLFTSGGDSDDRGRNEGLGSLFASPECTVEVGMVELRSLDAVCDSERVVAVHCIKIDVEGSELAVLRGAGQCLRRCRPVLLLEMNAATFGAAGYTYQAVAEELLPLGYQLFAIDRCGRPIPAAITDLPGFCHTLWLPPRGYACAEADLVRVLRGRLEGLPS